MENRTYLEIKIPKLYLVSNFIIQNNNQIYEYKNESIPRML